MKTRTFSKSDFVVSLKWAKKVRAAGLLGGCCHVCGQNDVRVLEFHHISDKQKTVSRLSDSRWSVMEKEVEKCLLLCRNCHLELHCSVSGRQSELKHALFENLGVTLQCKQCGYCGKNLASLGFHHRNGTEKRFIISDVMCRNFYAPAQELAEELQKCDILCANCHALEHIDTERFDRLRADIYRLAVSHRETKRAADKDLVVEMVNGGMKQIDVARRLGYAKSTICGILKALKK